MFALCDLSSLVLVLSPVKMVLIGKLISLGYLDSKSPRWFGEVSGKVIEKAR